MTSTMINHQTANVIADKIISKRSLSRKHPSSQDLVESENFITGYDLTRDFQKLSSFLKSPAYSSKQSLIYAEFLDTLIENFSVPDAETAYQRIVLSNLEMAMLVSIAIFTDSFLSSININSDTAIVAEISELIAPLLPGYQDDLSPDPANVVVDLDGIVIQDIREDIRINIPNNFIWILARFSGRMRRRFMNDEHQFDADVCSKILESVGRNLRESLLTTQTVEDAYQTAIITSKDYDNLTAVLRYGQEFLGDTLFDALSQFLESIRLSYAGKKVAHVESTIEAGFNLHNLQSSSELSVVHNKDVSELKALNNTMVTVLENQEKINDKLELILRVLYEN